MKELKVVLRIDTSGEYGRGIARGISNYCQQVGHWYLSQNLTYFDSTGHTFEPDKPENWNVDGVIIDSGQVPKIVLKHKIPVIAFDCYKTNLNMPEIRLDAQAIAEMAFNHFTERNFSHLAFCGFDGMDWVTQQAECFADCAKPKGLAVDIYQVESPKNLSSWEEELNKMGRWLRNLPHPLGLLTCNDDCAKLVINACRAASVSIPDEVAVLGVDNDDMVCLPIEPQISSIALDFEQAGFEAAALLDKLMKRQEKNTCQCIPIRPTQIKVRRSTNTFAIADTEIKSALQFISNHAHKAITVPDVVAATALSRRGLEYRFKKVLGRSISNVIRTQRVIKITGMLIETNLSISQISDELGFSSIERISHYFRREKGVSPSAFRKQHMKA